MRRSTCSAPECGADIVWAITAKGKRMPVDYSPAEGGNVELREDPATGDILAAVLGPLEVKMATAPMRMPHHATCPAADRFRK